MHPWPSACICMFEMFDPACTCITLNYGCTVNSKVSLNLLYKAIRLSVHLHCFLVTYEMTTRIKSMMIVGQAVK